MREFFLGVKRKVVNGLSHSPACLADIFNAQFSNRDHFYQTHKGS